MAADSFTEVSSESWFSRIGNSIKGIVVGIVLIVVSIGLLSWNEGRAVKRYKTLNEGAGAVISLQSASVDSTKDGKLVHTTGFASTEDRPTDAVFGLSCNALQLIRSVEMYQWQENKSEETKKKLGGGTETVTTYNYVKEWSSHHQNSANFKEPTGHSNPDFAYNSQTFTAKPVTLGAYTLTDSQVNSIGGAQPFTFPSDYKSPASLGQATVSGTTIYIGKDPSAPAIGDLRISFKEVPQQDISLVAAQIGSTFEPYLTEAGGTISLLERGTVSAGAMFQTAQDSNKTLTWILRGAGLFLMCIGFNMIMAPLSVLADIVPFIGNLVGAGTAIVAMLLTAVAGLITIAVAWIVFRPILAVSLLLIAGGALFMIFSKMKAKSA